MSFKIFVIVCRFFLATTYLWVIADRLSLLGPAGNMGVVWGNFETFLNYTASITPWFPKQLSYVLGYVATIVELVLAIFFVFNIKLKETFLASFLLLVTFTISMIFSLGFKQAYDFIIFTILLATSNWYIFWRIKKAQG
ncbi:MauE/DoxX family redox-associated membrane protein [Bacteriovorax sp. Seq25_V]|uniref:MauE/DoxX family redox-associated membrane protein n=1 Tax=Bacteriovorax sp. Seq25_V TaxID=1201288 RepID=UPI000389ED02|nr:MauE/DoxX family redox-associated membrane protein [Bacteriovorax sp. Seq25_V]EQC47628.1 hypothetical protein M900_0883 [Bacteriovorax sp. Seq25_V]